MQTQHSTMVYTSTIPKEVEEAYKRWDSLLPGTILHNAAYLKLTKLCAIHKVTINRVISEVNVKL